MKWMFRIGIFGTALLLFWLFQWIGSGDPEPNESTNLDLLSSQKEHTQEENTFIQNAPAYSQSLEENEVIPNKLEELKPRDSHVPAATEETQPLPNKTINAPYEKAIDSLLAKRQGDFWVTQGDILVDEESLLKGVGDDEFRITAMGQVRYWPGGVIPFTISAGVNENLLYDAMEEFHQKTAIRFVEHAGEVDFVQFEGADLDVCQSYLGQQGGMQRVLLHETCTRGQISHELMHILGFVHEHSRSDRDEFVVIEWDHIVLNQKNQFQKIDASISMVVETPFDFESILMYPSNAFSKNGMATIVRKDGGVYFANRDALSETDIFKVNQIAKM